MKIEIKTKESDVVKGQVFVKNLYEMSPREMENLVEFLSTFTYFGMTFEMEV